MHFLSMKDGVQQTSQIKNWLTEAGFTLQLGQHRPRQDPYNICSRNAVQCPQEKITSLLSGHKGTAKEDLNNANPTMCACSSSFVDV